MRYGSSNVKSHHWKNIRFCGVLYGRNSNVDKNYLSFLTGDCDKPVFGLIETYPVLYLVLN